MSSIKVINTIRLCSKGVLAKDANGKYVKLHKRQGDMDGACSVYSLAMALLCLGVVTEDDLNIYNKPDRRTQKSTNRTLGLLQHESVGKIPMTL